MIAISHTWSSRTATCCIRASRSVAAGMRPGSPEHLAISERYHEQEFGDWIPELRQRYGLKVIGEP